MIYNNKLQEDAYRLTVDTLQTTLFEFKKYTKLDYTKIIRNHEMEKNVKDM